MVFTGSVAVATTLSRALAAREGARLPLIAETGGLNVMIADTNGPCLMEPAGRMPVHNAAVQICIDRKKIEGRPDAALRLTPPSDRRAG